MWTRLRAIVSRLTFMLARRRMDEDMRLEIDAHLEALTDHYHRQGMPRDEAYLAARRQFGNPAVLRQDIHEMNSFGWIEHTVQDLRYALRQLARRHRGRVHRFAQQSRRARLGQCRNRASRRLCRASAGDPPIQPEGSEVGFVPVRLRRR